MAMTHLTVANPIWMKPMTIEGRIMMILLLCPQETSKILAFKVVAMVMMNRGKTALRIVSKMNSKKEEKLQHLPCQDSVNGKAKSCNKTQ